MDSYNGGGLLMLEEGMNENFYKFCYEFSKCFDIVYWMHTTYNLHDYSNYDRVLCKVSSENSPYSYFISIIPDDTDYKRAYILNIINEVTPAFSQVCRVICNPISEDPIRDILQSAFSKLEPDIEYLASKGKYKY